MAVRVIQTELLHIESSPRGLIITKRDNSGNIVFTADQWFDFCAVTHGIIAMVNFDLDFEGNKH